MDPRYLYQDITILIAEDFGGNKMLHSEQGLTLYHGEPSGFVDPMGGPTCPIIGLDTVPG